MSYAPAKGAWEVRWRDAADRRRSRSFRDEEAARAFDEAMLADEGLGAHSCVRQQRGGIYAHQTRAGTRWR